MDLEQMKELIKAVSQSNVKEFFYKEGNIEISIENGNTAEPVRVMGQTVRAVEQPQVFMAEPVTESIQTDDGVYKIVKSPLVGTFYCSASPDAEPFVKVGDRVNKGQVLGIVEAMKLMNDIESEFDGEIVEILVNNKDMVEFDQPLFKIR